VLLLAGCLAGGFREKHKKMVKKTHDFKEKIVSLRQEKEISDQNHGISE